MQHFWGIYQIRWAGKSNYPVDKFLKGIKKQIKVKLYQIIIITPGYCRISKKSTDNRF